MIKQIEKLIVVILIIVGTILGIYAYYAAVNCHEYISKLVEQNQFQINGNLFKVVNYYIVNSGVYVVYGILLISSAIFFIRIIKIEKSLRNIINNNPESETVVSDIPDSGDQVIGNFEPIEEYDNKESIKTKSMKDPFKQEMIVKPFSMATLVLEVYERIEICLKTKGVKLVVDIERAFDCDIMVDSEKGIQAIADILWWAADFLEEESSILIIANENVIELLLPQNLKLFQQFRICIEQYKRKEKESVLFAEINYIYDIQGNIEIFDDNRRIQITFPTAK